MPGPALDPVETDAQPPRRVDVAIIGAGVIGLSTAFALVRRGFSVVVLEKGCLAGEQSSRNWGWCRVSRRDPREIPLALEAARLWDGMNEAVAGETGYRRSGILFGCETDVAVRDAEEWLGYAAPYQLSSTMIGPDRAAALLPGATKRLAGALYTPTDGRAEPQKFAPALAAAIRRRGGAIVEGCAVRGLDVSAGRVTGVITERGRIAADAVVLAGGAWSRLFARGQRLVLPQLKVLNTVLRTDPVAGGPDGAGWIGDFSFRKRLDGGYTISNGMNNVVPIVPDSFRFGLKFLRAFLLEWRALKLRVDGRFLEEARDWRVTGPDEVSVFERIRVLDPAPVPASAEAAMRAACAFFPWLRGTRVAQTWGGLIDATPDALPVISPVESLPGFVIATGFSGHGFGISPAAGELCADLVTGARPLVDPSPFRFSRFSDGTPLCPMTGV